MSTRKNGRCALCYGTGRYGENGAEECPYCIHTPHTPEERCQCPVPQTAGSLRCITCGRLPYSNATPEDTNVEEFQETAIKIIREMYPSEEGFWSTKNGVPKYMKEPLSILVVRLQHELRTTLTTYGEAKKAEGARDEREHWINQPANEHDNRIREEERERIEAIFKEHVPPHAMDLEDSVWLKRLLNKAFNHDKNI